MTDIVKIKPRNLDECIKYSKLQRANGLYIYLHTVEKVLETLGEGLEYQLGMLSVKLVEEVFASIDNEAISDEVTKIAEKSDFKESMRIVVEHFLKLHAILHIVKTKIENYIKDELMRR